MATDSTTTSEAAAAREHWGSLGRDPFYEASQHWRPHVARQVAVHKPSSVLEFGCNAGRNLVEVRKLLPEAKLYGVDVNPAAVEFGSRAYELDLLVAGEEFLAEQDDNSIDVIFTVSVLDHVPKVEPVFDDLARVARRALVLLEPYIGRADRVDSFGANRPDRTALTRVAYTYSWDYVGLSRRLGDRWAWTWAPYPLSSDNMGPYYWMIVGVRH